MDRFIYTAMSGAKASMQQQAAVAHNLANATTTGFREEMHNFRAVPIQSPALATRAFVVDASVATKFTPGALIHTGAPYDAAINGQGWFAVQGADGKEAYTRNGNFLVDANGILRTNSGLAVVGDSGPVSIPPDNRVEIGADGTITATPLTGSLTAGSAVGRLKLVNPDEATLVRGDDGLFRTGNGVPATQDDNVRLASGYIEGSNVNVVDQVVSMMSLQRHFEMQTKLLTTAQEDDKAATSIITR